MTGSEHTGELTRLLRAHRAGDRAAFDALVPLVYQRMRRIAGGQVRRGGPGSTLDATALVHEVYMELVEETGIDWQDRTHFYAVCARAMRRIVVSYARRRNALKRGGGKPDLTLEPELATVEEQAELVLAVDGILDELGSFNERLRQVVECRFFAGMTEQETADALGTSMRTVQRDWQRASAWLRKGLE